MTTWRLLKQVPPEHDEPSSKTWAEIGTHDSDSDYSIGYRAASTIGPYHGPGEYLLIHDDRCAQLSIGARQEYYEIVDAEPEETEPVSLTAAPSAADVMQRDG